MKQMRALLETVAPYIHKGLFHAIRISTRPDAIDAHRMEMLRQFGVLTVELGAQSMNNSVLADSKRGHTAEDTVEAVKSLRAAGFKVGIQLMPGLPGDSKERFHATVSRAILLKPDMVRLYPTVVIEGTELAKRYREGRYQPLSLDAAVSWCADACVRFEAEEIPVIRIGLMTSPTLLEAGQILAGPWHPAFGFLVRSKNHFKEIEADLPSKGLYSRIAICAPEREIPLVRGYKNQGIVHIEKHTGARVVGVRPDDSIAKGRVRIEEA
jgi:histone acetyltransferase (RNA polymerase elongator complex component)